MFCTVNGCDCQLIIKENYDDDDDDGYNGDSETVNVLARHTALKR